MNKKTKGPQLEPWQVEIDLYLAHKQILSKQENEKARLLVSDIKLREYSDKLRTLRQLCVCEVCHVPADAPKFEPFYQDFVLDWNFPAYMAHCHICHKYAHVGNSSTEFDIPEVINYGKIIIPERKPCMHKGICKNCAEKL